jgi:hypothetical protein
MTQSAQPFNFDGYFDPPTQPEVSTAFKWHEAGEHKEDFRKWAKRGCEACQEDVEALTVRVELKFNPGDLSMARYWFRQYGHKYGPVANDRELLLKFALFEVAEYEELP